MVNAQPTSVAILGGGKGGSALLDLLANIPDVAIVGVADKDPAAPGIIRASELRIKVTANVLDLITDDAVNLIIDVTGDPNVQLLIQAHKQPGAEVLSGATARLLWNLVQHEKRMQAQLLRAEKLASIGTFASGLAHDINNPLYLILGLAENLAEDEGPPAVREQGRDIVNAVHRISALTNELTHYSRQSKSDVFQQVEVIPKLEEALRIARYATMLQDLNIVRDYVGRPTIKGNPEGILHVFVNLLTNAIHAMNGKGTLTLGVSWVNGMVRATISDTGCGISQANLGRIFEPFFTTKPAGKGTGLGLHNVLAIVKQLHGKVWVESDVDKGSSFHLEFPKT